MPFEVVKVTTQNRLRLPSGYCKEHGIEMGTRMVFEWTEKGAKVFVTPETFTV